MSQPSFKERTALLRDGALQLRAIAETVLAEVQHMEAAQTRFATKRQARTQKASR